jgi:YggT family protein
MGILYDLIVSLWYIVNTLLTIYTFIIIASALISWVNPDPYNPIVRFLHTATEPVLGPIRRRLPMTGIDFSPLIVILVIVFIQNFVARLLMRLH